MKIEHNKIYHMDFFLGLPHIPDKSIDMILCDLPYNKTHNKWDTPLDLDKLWFEYHRIIKDNGAIVLFGQDTFSAKLMLSNEKYHRYNLIWDKVVTTGFLNANRMPLRNHEDILVFYKKLPTYHPQKFKGKKSHSTGAPQKFTNNNYGQFKQVDNSASHGDMKFPRSIITIPRTSSAKMVHPTEKPVALFEWLIKTYTNEDEVVLDNCMGSGTTALAAMNTNRRYVGFELERDYVELANTRIEQNGKVYQD